MGKHIWIVNHYALPPYLSGGTRHFDYAKYLVKEGYNVTIIASSFHYQKLEDHKVYSNNFFVEEEIEGINFVWLKTAKYKKNNWKRFYNMLSYYKNLLKYKKYIKNKRPKIDVIIGSSVHLIAVYGAYKISKKNKTPFIMEVRDLWPKTLIDLGVPKYHPVIVFFSFLEKFLYKKADKIITLLPKSANYIKNKGIDPSKIEWLPNGVDISKYKQVTPLEKKEKNSKPFLLMYVGVIGIANNLDNILECAKLLKEDKNIFFKIIGDGQERVRLENLVLENNLKNIQFVGTVPKNEVVGNLKEADVLLFNLEDSPVFKYGLSSNKLFDYLASRKPIIFAHYVLMLKI